MMGTPSPPDTVPPAGEEVRETSSQVVVGFMRLQNALVQRCQELYVIARLGHVL